MKFSKKLSASLLVLGLGMSASAYAKSELAGYYIGIDGRINIPSGTYAGLPEPNSGNLTLLLNHGNHYHGIGAYSYTGPAASPSINDTNSNNRIPEISALNPRPPLELNWGSGSLYSGKLTSQNNPSAVYGNLTFARVDTLAGHETGSEEQILFNSSSNRWSTLLGTTSIGLQLISATPGLSIGNEQNTNLFANGNTLILDTYLDNGFAPIFWTAANAAAGTYTAEFRLIGLNDESINSGRFYFDFAPVAVPVPAAVWLFGSGLFGLLGLKHKHKLGFA
ncbi:MAG: all3515 family Zur-repressed PEP-CTERM protein [Methylicorpusculum sp.]|uniref:all3515 family Zur-repressed PEP-CTERM protein n=1 Tax=Methylicorpusculum sp. TaxID=2713644 RepID=UPI0027283ED8|nr:all3515 family Zur-repressed PEP-CTERM protein [Methylicorpusculum sp.]MDZ4099500.1 all3515 family Zur-repressed PEP-CTERM protein [Methylophilaceae bacterium]MDO8843278.1 all3515 family Zur-repressed PEP-CTERM protein [Methylicorpusculum sp.]MDO8938644.1 all3515 family Zur-repressed PEP-CTERM protein [Methylicorpusculum sp.]MDO9240278.1 all3515 family Zur-repressed PEP-CTERM protein [Methylicorpusculum sp.]MDP2179237.1 all3515 family Zur-repressed PEP-CTERM protein [Methylicorpusculum sp.]